MSSCSVPPPGTSRCAHHMLSPRPFSPSTFDRWGNRGLERGLACPSLQRESKRPLPEWPGPVLPSGRCPAWALTPCSPPPEWFASSTQSYILRDLDDTSVVEDGRKKLNTLAHYKVGSPAPPNPHSRLPNL